MNIITIPHTVVRAYDCHQNLLMGCHSVVPDMTDVHCTCVLNEGHVATSTVYRARQSYKNISMLFLFPVKTVSLLQASMHNFSYCVTVDLQ